MPPPWQNGWTINRFFIPEILENHNVVKGPPVRDQVYLTVFSYMTARSNHFPNTKSTRYNATRQVHSALIDTVRAHTFHLQSNGLSVIRMPTPFSRLKPLNLICVPAGYHRNFPSPVTLRHKCNAITLHVASIRHMRSFATSSPREPESGSDLANCCGSE